MVETNRSNLDAMKVVCSKVLGRNNLIGTDISAIMACRVEDGFTFQFDLSAEGLGKVLDEDLNQAVDTLLANCHNEDEDVGKGQQIISVTTQVFDESDFPELR